MWRNCNDDVEGTVELESPRQNEPLMRRFRAEIAV